MAPSAPAKPGSKGLMEKGLDFISNVGSNLTFLYRAATLAAVMKCAGCAVEGNEQPEPAGIEYAVQQAALTKETVKNLKNPEKAGFSVPGIDRVNFATIDGKPYATYILGGKFYLVGFSNLEVGFAQPSNPKQIYLPNSFDLDGEIDSAVIAGSKIIYFPNLEGGRIADLDIVNGEVLGIKNPQSHPIAANQITLVSEGGIDYILYDGATDKATGNSLVVKENFQNGTYVITKLDAAGGLPTNDDETGTWVGSYKAGSLWRLSAASTLEQLQGSQKQPAVQLLPGKSITDPRRVKDSTGEYIAFVVRTPDPQNPGKFLPSEYYFQKLESGTVNPDPSPDVDAGSTETDGGVTETTDGNETTDGSDADTTDSTEKPDATDTPDAEDVKDSEDTQDTEDTEDSKDIEDIKDSGSDDTADGSTDATDTEDAKDTQDTKDSSDSSDSDTSEIKDTSETKPDTSKPDTEPTPECVAEIPDRIKLKVGPCEMEICPTQIGAYKGHTMHVMAENAAADDKCKAEVFIKGISTPAILTFTNTKGGKIDVTCTVPEEIGEDPDCTVGTPNNKVDIDEEGHKFHTKDKKGKTATGSTATKYAWEYMGIDSNTQAERFAVANNEDPGKPPLIVSFTDGGKPFIVESGKGTYFVNVLNGEIVDEKGNLVHGAIVDPPVEGGKDVDVSSQPINPPQNPPEDPSCSASGAKPLTKNSAVVWIAIGSIALLSALRRRKEA